MNIVMTALQPGGGIRTFFRYVYSQPAFIDCRFLLIAPDEGLSDYLRRFLPEGRIELIPAQAGTLSFVKQVRSIVRVENPDLVHSHGFSAGLLTEIARTGSQCPHLMTAHDVFTAAQFPGIKGRCKQWLLARIFRRMDAIHTVTEDAKANFLEFFPSVKATRIHGILHGIDTEYFLEGRSRDFRGELGLTDSTPLIGFFGRFMGQKGFRILVDAMEQMSQRVLPGRMPHVLTFGWGGYVREDYAYLKAKGLDQVFHQMPQTDDMPSALKGVDVIAMPSRWEACGLLAMEALSAGVPIVGSDCVGLREVLEHSPAQLITTGSSESLSNALVQELANLKGRRDEFERFQEVAARKFSITRPSNELKGLYESILGKRALDRRLSAE
ncbi:MAG: glycosyltransferase family 4 protein [Marinobacter sp.]|uniref:glycosyltransferase family 4 protein n=1 Tax=Marinobacter sp. TaxID=50741 RepID=UPI00299D6BA7|nr:glycosyltransferase family 4 protein [Marinobacter sp.]MDX1754889.1 glycosyltransferase family 4 protein [Marinobacter sp.]